ncbi:N-acetylglucosamine-6-phosphate deacetylase [uncultured Microbacterium sp.]|uniref:N-acetylglucosamine-6-phosphate deacetylase n=1 Tax=uncultured Microbacterium sp. TaxID=191216 RepID=UPI0025F464D6|nr:amidohydrolase family protein [uncultured Microbacterium sp.]
MRHLLSAAHVIVGAADAGPGWLIVEDGVIRRLETGTPGDVDLRDATVTAFDTVAAGFVDTHVHGALGIDFGDPGVDPGPAIAHHRRAGVAAVLASIATSAPRDLLTRIAELRPLVARGELAGLHLEGPWLSPLRRGAHAPHLLRAPTADEIDRVLTTAEGTVRMVTIAPELPGALDAVARLVDAGVVVALGHSDADADTARRAMDAGASVVTHVFNGMPPLSAREPGLVGAALSRPEVTVELIADGIHVSDTVIDVVIAAAGQRMSLVSDAMSATGLGDGEYVLAGNAVAVRDGVARTVDGTSLAGGTMTLGGIVARLIGRGIPPLTVVTAAACTPARALGIEAPRLRVGGRADLVGVSDRSVRTMAGGSWLAS